MVISALSIHFFLTMSNRILETLFADLELILKRVCSIFYVDDLVIVCVHTFLMVDLKDIK